MSSECSSGGDVCGEGEENSVPTAVVDISFVSLVAERGRREDGDGVMREEEEGIKNFKKFRKVYSTCIWKSGSGRWKRGLGVVTIVQILWLAVASSSQ